jgi:hypothetical protein
VAGEQGGQGVDRGLPGLVRLELLVVDHQVP